MSERPKHKTLVVTGLDKERGVLTFANGASREAACARGLAEWEESYDVDPECPPGVFFGLDRDAWTFKEMVSVCSVPTLWQRIRGAWYGMLDGWRYGDQ